MLSKPGTFDGGLSEGAAPPPEGYIQPHLGHGLRIWWAYYWPTLLISTLLIIVFTILLRKAWENVMVSGHFVIWASRVLPYIVLAFVSPLGIWRILTKKFKSFQIALLPRYAAFGAEPLSCSFQRTLRVWWAFLWRAVVYSLIFRFAGSVGLGMTLGFLTSVAGPLGPLVSLPIPNPD